jgi:hypothetical protein
MDNSFWMKHQETGGLREFPNEDGVQAYWEARGWALTDAPEDRPSVPVPVDLPPGDTTFVAMYHPVVRTTHEFPNNAEAVAGAQEAGWTLEMPVPALPPTDAPETPETGDETPDVAKKSTRRKTDPTVTEKESE